MGAPQNTCTYPPSYTPDFGNPKMSQVYPSEPPPSYEASLHPVDPKSVFNQVENQQSDSAKKTANRSLFCRMITCALLPVTFLIGTVLAPLYEITKAVVHFCRAVVASVFCIFCSPCIMIPAISLLLLDLAGGVVYGIFTGGYRFTRASIDPEYRCLDSVYPYLNEKYENHCNKT